MIWHAVLVFVQVLGWLTLATTAAAFVAGALHELGEWRAQRAAEVEELERHLTGLRVDVREPLFTPEEAREMRKAFMRLDRTEGR